MGLFGRKNDDPPVSEEDRDLTRSMTDVDEEKEDVRWNSETYFPDEDDERTVSFGDYGRTPEFDQVMESLKEDGNTVQLTDASVSRELGVNPVEVVKAAPLEETFPDLSERLEEELSDLVSAEPGSVEQEPEEAEAVRAGHRRQETEEPDSVKSQPADPAREILYPVGWLICVEGIAFGRSFGLQDGKNYISLEPDLEIRKTEKTDESREIAWIEYREEDRSFHLVPGPGGRFIRFYVNDEMIFRNPVKLQPKDIISIEEFSFRLIACCDEEFSWKTLG